MYGIYVHVWADSKLKSIAAGVFLRVQVSCTVMLNSNDYSTSTTASSSTSCGHSSKLRSIAVPHRVAHALRAGHFSCLRALAQAILVAAIFLTKSSSRAVEISSGGPPSMSSLLGSPWLSKFLKRLGLLKLT